MAFVDSVKEMFSQAGQSAKGLSDIAKLNHTISTTEEQINELYTKIGYIIYCKHANAPLPEVAEMIKQVNVLHAQINECKAQITAINNADICPHCGGKINRNSAFCPNCGNRIESVIKTPVQQAPVQQAPVQQTPVQQTPVQQTPVQQTPVQQAPVQQTPIQQTPVQQAPVQQTPVQQTPVQQAPAEEAPASEINVVAYCSNCGGPLAADSVFCMNCGTKVQ